MRKVLVTGGTVFVSRSVAEYFVKKGDEVYVLNRDNLQQSEGVHLIKCDRHQLGDTLKDYDFDVVIDVTAYTKQDVEELVEALGEIKNYVFISSSAVYPETNIQPFTEEQQCGPNSIWGAYGTNKIEAEKYLMEKVPQAYILRPPYLYGPYNNVYREAFVFECADLDRPFYVPKDGSMPLQFFHVEDLCKMIDVILEKKPSNKVFNVGNKETVDINEWVKLCYKAAGKKAELVYVDETHAQRSFFSFHDYGYVLDVTKQSELLTDTKILMVGLKEAYEWYKDNKEQVWKKDYISYIDYEINKS